MTKEKAFNKASDYPESVVGWATFRGVDNLQAVVAAVPEKKEPQEGVKMHTSLSVPILAVIARLFKDSGMITNPNHTEILKFFTNHFTTQQKAEFSYDHLRTRYYQVEEGTKKKVYDYLMVMAQLCKKL